MNDKKTQSPRQQDPKQVLEIAVAVEDDGVVTLSNVPGVGGVRMRRLTRADRPFLKQLQEEPDTFDEQLLAHVVTKWGDKDSVTPIDLMGVDEITFDILADALTEFILNKRHRFVFNAGS